MFHVKSVHISMAQVQFTTTDGYCKHTVGVSHHLSRHRRQRCRSTNTLSLNGQVCNAPVSRLPASSKTSEMRVFYYHFAIWVVAYDDYNYEDDHTIYSIHFINVFTLELQPSAMHWDLCVSRASIRIKYINWRGTERTEWSCTKGKKPFEKSRFLHKILQILIGRLQKRINK